MGVYWYWADNTNPPMQKGNKMNESSFSINGLQNPAEVTAAWQAVLLHRNTTIRASEASPEDQKSHVIETGSDTAERIYRGFTLPMRLEGRYIKIFREWLAAPQGEKVKIEELAKKVGASIGEVRASTAKLSLRMKRIATPEEIATLWTPFLLLADLTYDEHRMARYALTPAGRDAVRRFVDA